MQHRLPVNGSFNEGTECSFFLHCHSDPHTFITTVLPEEILSLWRRAAVITPLSGPDLQVGDRGPESTDSEREREREAMQEAAAEEQRADEISTEVWPGVSASTNKLT